MIVMMIRRPLRDSREMKDEDKQFNTYRPVSAVGRSTI